MKRKRCKHTKARTYKEWGQLGYHVIRGQKATGRNADGVCTFKRSQVERNNNYYRDEDDDREDDELYFAIYGDEHPF